MLYLRYEAKYRHVWATAIPKNNCKGVDPPADSEDDFWLVTISCSKKKNSADSRFDKRPSAVQFQWFKDVLGQDPCWVMTERSLYTIVGRGVWARGPCCEDVRQGGSSNLKEAHLVDLETGKWVCDRDQGRKE
uniref:Type III effector protein n=1 Tax=Ganoderma boninense TaxID=34458 RepID=A0A5K1JV54_9APHY|nr:Putative type III effector protein [Ganoderma boninense]